MSRSRLQLALCLCALFSCACAWNGYVSGDLTLRQFEAGEMKVTGYFIEPNDKEREQLSAAIQETLEVINDPMFRASVVGFDHWIASVDTKGTSLPGQEVYQALVETSYERLQFLSNDPWRATAVTQIHPHSTNHGIVIDPEQIARWSAHSESGRAKLINTIAHEFTHVVQDSEQSMRFLDDGHDNETRKRLVSYRIGTTAECTYLVKHGLEESVTKCVKANAGKLGS